MSLRCPPDAAQTRMFTTRDMMKLARRLSEGEDVRSATTDSERQRRWRPS